MGDIARLPKSSQPVEGNTGNQARNCFSFEDKNNLHPAVFNFSDTNASFNVILDQLGLKSRTAIHEKELWSGTDGEITNSLSLQLSAKDAVLYKISRP
jgi:hypothetical protein